MILMMKMMKRKIFEKKFNMYVFIYCFIHIIKIYFFNICFFNNLNNNFYIITTQNF